MLSEPKGESEKLKRELERLITESSSRNRRLSWLIERERRPQRGVSPAKHQRHRRRIASAADAAEYAAEELQAFKAAMGALNVDR